MGTLNSYEVLIFEMGLSAGKLACIPEKILMHGEGEFIWKSMWYNRGII